MDSLPKCNVMQQRRLKKKVPSVARLYVQGVPERSIRSKLAVPTIEGALWQKINDRKEGSSFGYLKII